MTEKIKKLSPEGVRELDIIWFGKPNLPEPLQKVLDAVERYEKRGKFDYMAICPVHNDHNPSLSITWSPTSCKVLLHCFGCEAKHKEIIDSLGLKESDLFIEPKYGPKKRVAEYDYRDEKGKLLYWRFRYEPKSFYYYHPDPTDPENPDKAIKGLNGIEPIL